ncbi:hypothetical protein E2C01_035215 [Portunus trituberculatus]|uniref:Uncharacterized protein n=1 Tax=Portunus trituberculatus TaxID=210409 RepID=A0A5B7FAW7_PORTR|nr:hypothetical protein [Portunus trituberculatus]
MARIDKGGRSVRGVRGVEGARVESGVGGVRGVEWSGVQWWMAVGVRGGQRSPPPVPSSLLPQRRADDVIKRRVTQRQIRGGALNTGVCVREARTGRRGGTRGRSG